MATQTIHGSLCGEHPVIELEGDILRSEAALKETLAATLIEHLLWGETTHEFRHLLSIALGHEPFAC